MKKYKIETFVQIKQGRVRIPADIRKFLKIKDNEYLRLTAEENKIELIPLGVTLIDMREVLE